MNTLQEALAELLDESLDSAARRERSTFDQLTSNAAGIVLFGAGGLGRIVLNALRANGIEPIAFVDNRMQGTVFEGVPVYSPKVGAERWGRSAAFVVTVWSSWSDTFREQRRLLMSLGCDTVVSFIPLLWKFKHLLPHIQVDLPTRVLENKTAIEKASTLWADEISFREFLAQLRWRLFGDFELLSDPMPNQYWQRDILPLKNNPVYVDAGAFDGDTLMQFLAFTRGDFRGAYLFEPDQRNVEALRRRVGTLSPAVQDRIQIYDCAVSEHESTETFTSGAGASSILGSGSEKIRCVSLDRSLPECPDLIKYDIEGFELRGIAGTRRIIAEVAPALIVCAYHIQSHIWEIPLAIHEINPTYKFFLRPHGQIWETVCYAIPQ